MSQLQTQKLITSLKIDDKCSRNGDFNTI